MKKSHPMTITSMSIEVTSNADDLATFTIRGVGTPLVNALRRAMLCRIPVAAMRGFPSAESTINITHNSGPFNNEILKQRLQCIPVHLTDRGLDLDQYTADLDVTATDQTRVVTTKDISMRWGPDNAAVQIGRAHV